MKGLIGNGPAGGGGDVSAALARLNFGVEDLNRQLKGEVSISLSKKNDTQLMRLCEMRVDYETSWKFVVTSCEFGRDRRGFRRG